MLLPCSSFSTCLYILNSESALKLQEAGNSDSASECMSQPRRRGLGPKENLQSLKKNLRNKPILTPGCLPDVFLDITDLIIHSSSYFIKQQTPDRTIQGKYISLHTLHMVECSG